MTFDELKSAFLSSLRKKWSLFAGSRTFLFFSRKKVVSLFFLFFILVSLPLGVYQVIKSRELTKSQAKKEEQIPLDLDVVQPAGIYAVFTNDDVADFEDISEVLENPVVSGVALRLLWEDLEPQKEQYNFSLIDRTLKQAKSKNKTVSLIIVPGFFTPSWVLEKISSCDPYLKKNTDGNITDCGKAKFTISYGQRSGEKKDLPLPWNQTYKSEWQRFLAEIARRYNQESAVVSIAVAGPTSMSAEMSLPNETPEELEKWRKLLELLFPPGDYRESNKIVIEEWQKMIDYYGQVFRGKTIIITRGSGLLRFQRGDQREAKDQIIAYFQNADTGQNLKATQTSGLKACRDTEEGIEGVKQLAFDTKDKPFLERILGGAQFNSSATLNPDTMGCTQPSCDCQGARVSPEQAVTNVLRNYFNNTAYAEYWGAAKGEAPIHYLQVYSKDILYTNSHSSVQKIFKQASENILGVTSSTADRSSQKTRGIYALANWNEKVSKGIWELPYVDGVTIRTYWKNLNPKKDRYNWGFLDEQFEMARENKKKIRFIVAPGFYSPDWVLNDPGVEKVMFSIPTDEGDSGLKPLPLPWNETYLTYWFDFVSKVAERYKDNRWFTGISATGPNGHNGEVSLPRERHDQEKWLELSGGDREKLMNLLLVSWQKTIDTFCSEFSGKHFTLAFITQSFPIKGDPELEKSYKEQLLSYGIGKCKDTFGVQTNGLDGRPVFPEEEPLSHWQYIKDYSDQILTGFQTKAPTNIFPEGRRTDSELKKRIYRQALIDNGISRNTAFIEVYEGDILDDDLTDIIRLAHQTLMVEPTPIGY